MELGNAAEWAAALVAAVAAWIALSTYKTRVGLTKVAAARLVWAEN
jgi:hypothetical protein